MNDVVSVARNRQKHPRTTRKPQKTRKPQNTQKITGTSIMLSLTVDLGERSYPILIGPGLLGTPSLLTPYIRGGSALIVSNEVVAPLYMDKLRASLGDTEIDTLVLADGEHTKNLET